jgi:hypothetical protein
MEKYYTGESERRTKIYRKPISLKKRYELSNKAGAKQS